MSINRLNRICFKTLFVLLSYPGLSQKITGTIYFIDNEKNQSYTLVSTVVEQKLCDSLGYFQIKRSNRYDLLTIMPSPEYIPVKIYHFPDSISTLKLDSIPIFNQPETGIPIINFKSKRASRKFFKNLARKQDIQRQETITAIRNSWISVNGKRIPLLLQQKSDTWIILIDLSRECL